MRSSGESSFQLLVQGLGLRVLFARGLTLNPWALNFGALNPIPMAMYILVDLGV